MRTKYFIWIATVCSFALPVTMASAHEGVLAKPLEPVRLNVCWVGVEEQLHNTGLTIELQGTLIGKNTRHFDLEKREYYNDPLFACVAALSALLDEDELWYGKVAATRDQREESGEVKEGFVPDSQENLFVPYTWHRNEPRLGYPVEYDIVLYARIGKIHAFQTYTTSNRPPEYYTTFFKWVGFSPYQMEFVQEFSSGRFRLAYDWMQPGVDLIRDMLHSTVLETPDQKSAREADSAHHYEVVINELFGDEENLFPARLLFRGGTVDDQQEYRQIKNIMHRLADLSVEYQSMNSQEEFDRSSIKPELKQLLQDGFEVATDMDYRALRFRVPQRLFFIDGTDVITVLYAHADTQQPFTGVFFFLKQDGSYQFLNYPIVTTSERFFLDERVYEPLVEKIGSIMMSQ